MKRRRTLVVWLAVGAATIAAASPSARHRKRKPTPPIPTTMPSSPSAKRHTWLPRRDLLRVLDAGPAAFLQRVDVKPWRSGGRFSGWEVVTIEIPGEIVPRDVVLSVNGLSLERPEQFQAIWDSLRRAPRLEIKTLRDGKPLALILELVD